jgi:hypothetical protein
MSEQRLIDANELLEDIESSKENHGMVQIIADMLTRYVKRVPIIDPETLPIVQELREKLERVTAQRDELFKMLNDVCKDTREQHVDESVCGLCEYDGAYIGQSGDWENECPGFNSDDCFCMKRSIIEKFGQLENMSLYGQDGDHT